MTEQQEAESRHLLVFARHPELGRVKTRLAQDVGEATALAVYRELLALTRSAIANLPATVWLAAAPTLEASPTELREWPGLPWQVQPANPDLGARMAAAFEVAFAAGATRVLVIGTDCPGLQNAHLTAAFEQLRTHDVVLGPATDGGYYLLGMNMLYAELFANKTWSTASVLPDTVADAQRLGLSVVLLPELADVDTGADLLAWREVSQRLAKSQPE